MRNMSGRIAALAAGLAIFSISTAPAFADDYDPPSQDTEYNQVFTSYAGDPESAVENARQLMLTAADTGEFAGGGCNEVNTTTTDVSDTDAVTTWQGQVYAYCWGGK